MTCKLCRKFCEQYPLQKNDEGDICHDLGDYLSDPIRCAFTEGDFNTDNWSCETMRVLRAHCRNPPLGHRAIHFRDDLRACSVGLLQIPESDDETMQQGYLVMSWYKNRGRTGRAMVMWDDKEPSPLTLKTAEFLVQMFCEAQGGDN